MGGDIRWHFLIPAQGRLTTSLCKVKHDRIIASGALGGNAMRLLERPSEGVVVSTLPWALCAMFG
jgi:hypothetical protein